MTWTTKVVPGGTSIYSTVFAAMRALLAVTVVPVDDPIKNEQMASVSSRIRLVVALNVDDREAPLPMPTGEPAFSVHLPA